MNYDNEFKQEALKLSDEIGVKKASEQLGVPYYTLADWRSKRKQYGEYAIVGSGKNRKLADPKEQRIRDLEKEVRELQKANDILKDALGFFATSRKK